MPISVSECLYPHKNRSKWISLGCFYVCASVSTYQYLYSPSVSHRSLNDPDKMKGKLLAVSMSEKVLELVRLHPVLYDQWRQDVRDTAVAAVFEKHRKSTHGRCFGHVFAIYQIQCTKFFHCNYVLSQPRFPGILYTNISGINHWWSLLYSNLKKKSHSVILQMQDALLRWIQIQTLWKMSLKHHWPTHVTLLASKLLVKLQRIVFTLSITSLRKITRQSLRPYPLRQDTSWHPKSFSVHKVYSVI